MEIYPLTLNMCKRTRIPPKAMPYLGRNMCQWHTIATIRANEFLILAHCLMILYICTKICENISKCFRIVERTQSAYWNLPGGIIMWKLQVELCNLSLHIIWWPFIFKPGFKKISPRVSKLLSRHILKFTKGHNSITNEGGVTVLVLCTLQSFVKVSQTVSELETQTVGSTLGWSQFTKRHNSVKTVHGVTVLNLYTSSDDALYLYQV